MRSLAQLLEDQDAEVFLILPRLVLLSGLREPKHLALAAWLLPELAEEASGGEPCGIGAAKRMVLESSLTWSVLMEQAVQGGEGKAFRALEALSMQMQRRKTLGKMKQGLSDLEQLRGPSSGTAAALS